jgi:sugar phosphate isomerase/epimerase
MTNRKQFLQQSALLAAGMLLAPSCMLGSKSTPKSARNIGLQLYSLREIISQDVPGLIKRISDIGYRDVETYGFSSTSGYWGLAPSEFKSLLDEHDVVSNSGHYGLDDFIRTGNDTELKSIIEAASVLKQHYVTVPYLGDDLRTTADDFKRTIEALNKAAALCKDAGLKLAYHNHDFELKDLGDGQTGLQIFLENSDATAIDFELDLYWVVRAGQDPVSLFTTYPGRFTMWHVKDMDKNKPELNTEIGDGSIDFKSIFAAADTAGLKHFYVEQENFSKEPYQSITESITHIKQELI